MPCRVARLLCARHASADVRQRRRCPGRLVGAAGARLVRGRRRGRSSAMASRTPRPRTCRSSRGDPRPHRRRPRRDLCSPTAAPSTSTRNTTVDFQSDELVRLLDGRVRLSIPGPRPPGRLPDRRAGRRRCEIDAPGEYRVSPAAHRAGAGGRARRAARRGEARQRPGAHAAARRRARRTRAQRRAVVCLRLQLGRVGRIRSLVRGAARSAARRSRPSTFPRRCARTRRPSTGRAWRYDASYGYVWYPAVSTRTGGRITNGRWVRLRPAMAGPGSARIRVDWPTHHYGRWGISAGAWFWIPGAQLGSGLGLVGVRARLCELVPARLEQPAGRTARERAGPRLRSRGAPGRLSRFDTSAWLRPRRGGKRTSIRVRRGIRRPRKERRTFAATPSPDRPRRFALRGPAPGRAGSPVYTNLEPGASRVTAGTVTDHGRCHRARRRLPASPRPSPERWTVRAPSRDETDRHHYRRPTSSTCGRCQRGITGCHCDGPVRNAAAADVPRDTRGGGAPQCDRGDVRAARYRTHPCDRGRSVVGSIDGSPGAGRAVRAMAPHAYPQNSAQPRGRSRRRQPVYRPMPAPPGRAARLQRADACRRLTPAVHPRARRSRSVRPAGSRDASVQTAA